MTSLLEKTISVIAPTHCFVCSKESNILCSSCYGEVFGERPEICFLCNKPTIDSSTCEECHSRTCLSHVWAAGAYEGVAKRLIRAFKFERLRSAYKPLADSLCQALPHLGSDVLVVHIPTAPQRRRQRGYDQAELLAKGVARQRRWKHLRCLRRIHGLRQVGSSRIERQKQAQSAFELAHPSYVAGRHILLVDDVTTSGATLMAAAKLFEDAGAARVDAVVVARHTLE